MEHVNAWRDTWNTGRIEVTGDIQLAKTTWFAQYYLLSSLPSRNPYLPPLYSEVYYGASRTGLGKGIANEDYQGHIMWDNEFYILPAILQFQPDLAKRMLRYRYRTFAAFFFCSKFLYKCGACFQLASQLASARRPITAVNTAGGRSTHMI